MINIIEPVALNPIELIEGEMVRLQAEILQLKDKQKEHVAKINELETARYGLNATIVQMSKNEEFLKKIINSQIEVIEYFTERG